ncbi:DUF3168 domain-containing protein [Chitinimonas sp.]|uniref:DUF3168 domain-containing protein n=1 Tax=Chitinimonas sp. TaxID=1934313 RepID=UPI0035AF84F5
MSTGKAIYAILSAAPTISASVGNRIYPMLAPPNVAAPYIIYQVISGNSSQRALIAGNRGRERVQLTCWSTSYGAAQALADVVTVALDRISGRFGGVDVRDFVSGGYAEQHDPETNRFGVILDFHVTVRA